MVKKISIGAYRKFISKFVFSGKPIWIPKDAAEAVLAEIKEHRKKHIASKSHRALAQLVAHSIWAGRHYTNEKALVSIKQLMEDTEFTQEEMDRILENKKLFEDILEN